MDSLVVVSVGGLSGATETELQVARAFCDAGHDVWLTPHLYHLPSEHPLWERLRTETRPLTVLVWLHPRPAHWLLRARGIQPEQISATINLAENPLPESSTSVQGELIDLTEQLEHERWYPVVDDERCTNCRHCLQFCLFGVHNTDEDGHVRVGIPDNCKTGCPACSRICPAGAIMFPIYAKDAAIAGAPGLLMSPDADAKRMFYMRTGAPCAVCGGNGEFRITLESRTAPKCNECGRPLLETDKVASPVHDEIDTLLGRLDQIAKKRP